jgi:hypothetical protein
MAISPGHPAIAELSKISSEAIQSLILDMDVLPAASSQEPSSGAADVTQNSSQSKNDVLKLVSGKISSLEPTF